MEEGTSVMAVQHKFNSSKPFTFPMFSGKLWNFKHPKRSRDLSNFKLQMVLGRLTRFSQYLRVNEVRSIKRSIDEGSSSISTLLKSSISRPLIIRRLFGKFLISSTIAVRSKESSCKNFGFVTIFGIVLSFEQSEISRVARGSIPNLLGRRISLSQSCKLRWISFLRIPIDGSISRKFVHLRTNFSRFGTPVKFGVIIRSEESVKSMNFNLSKFC